MVIGYDASEPAGAAIEAVGRLLAVRETIVQTVWVPYPAVAAPGVAGAPVPAVSEAAEEIDRNLRRGAERTAERGARLAAAQGLGVRPEAVTGARKRLAQVARQPPRPQGGRHRGRLARALGRRRSPDRKRLGGPRPPRPGGRARR